MVFKGSIVVSCLSLKFLFTRVTLPVLCSAPDYFHLCLINLPISVYLIKCVSPLTFPIPRVTLCVLVPLVGFFKTYFFCGLCIEIWNFACVHYRICLFGMFVLTHCQLHFSILWLYRTWNQSQKKSELCTGKTSNSKPQVNQKCRPQSTCGNMMK